MHIALFLHIYQPPTQYPKMVKKIARQSYGKIVALLEEFPQVKITLNINASLSEQFKILGLEELINRIIRLAERGQIEFTGSAAYHPILPDLPNKEITRQIKLNKKINQSIFGSAYETRGFYPPEMGYEDRLGEVVEKLGFEWMILDGSAVPEYKGCLECVYRRRNGLILAFLREDTLSFKIAFGRIKTILGLKRAISSKRLVKKKYIVLAMDGETFGHHQKKQLKFLRQLFGANKSDKRIGLVKISELMNLYKKRRSVELRRSTWGYTEDAEGDRVWVRWRNPKNSVHQILDELRKIAIEVVDNNDHKTREILDKALMSDTYWWASGKPFWYPGMIRQGADLFYQAVRKSSSASDEEKSRTKYLVTQKLDMELNKLRTRKQREKVLGKMIRE